MHVARRDGTCLLSTAPSREPCFELWSADAHCTHLYIRCELTLLWLYIVWLLEVSDALPLTLCGLSSLNAIAYMVDLLWSFFICLTNSAMMSKVLHTAYVFKCHPADVWFSLDGVRSLTFTVHIKCVVTYHLHFPWTPCNYFLLFCFLSSMFLRSSTNTLIFSFFLPRFLLSFGIFKPTKLSVSYIQRAEEKIFDSYHSLLYGFL